MSTEADDPLGHLDFDVDVFDSMGPQEFADSHSMAESDGRVVPTTTFRGVADRTRSIVMISPGESDNGAKFIEMVAGRRLIIATPDLREVRVIDIQSLPARHKLGVAAAWDLVRRGPDRDLRVVGEVIEETIKSGQCIPHRVVHRGLAKSLIATSMTGIYSLEANDIVRHMSSEQLAEFKLALDVFRAIGGVVTD